MDELRVPTIATRLDDARDFIAVARLVCDLGETLGLVDSAVLLANLEGHPVLCVDNADARWIDEEVWCHLRDSHVSTSRWFDNMHAYAIPLVHPRGIVGAIRFRRSEPIDDELRAKLVAFGTHVSVRLAQLGVTGRPVTLQLLTQRQLDVAGLAADGLTNHEIASALAISTNTVKKHLKDVFERLSLTNRTELARMIAQSPFARASVGSTESIDGITITRVG